MVKTWKQEHEHVEAVAAVVARGNRRNGKRGHIGDLLRYYYYLAGGYINAEIMVMDQPRCHKISNMLSR